MVTILLIQTINTNPNNANDHDYTLDCLRVLGIPRPVLIQRHVSVYNSVNSQVHLFLWLKHSRHKLAKWMFLGADRSTHKAILLLISGIEPNPGPFHVPPTTLELNESGTGHRTVQSSPSCCAHFIDHVKQVFTNMIQIIQMQEKSNDTEMKMNSYISEQRNGFANLIYSIISLEKKIDDCILNFDLRNDLMKREMNELNANLDRMENFMKQGNVRFFGIQEDMIDGLPALDKIIEMLNTYSSDPNWLKSDIAFAYREGRETKKQEEPRPLVVGFRLAEDKIFLLRDKKLRQNLKKLNVKISYDPTQKQLAELNFYREKGLNVYHKAGQLHVENANHEELLQLRKNDTLNLEHTEGIGKERNKHNIIHDQEFMDYNAKKMNEKGNSRQKTADKDDDLWRGSIVDNLSRDKNGQKGNRYNPLEILRDSLRRNNEPNQEEDNKIHLSRSYEQSGNQNTTSLKHSVERDRKSQFGNAGYREEKLKFDEAKYIQEPYRTLRNDHKQSDDQMRHTELNHVAKLYRTERQMENSNNTHSLNQNRIVAQKENCHPTCSATGLMRHDENIDECHRHPMKCGIGNTKSEQQNINQQNVQDEKNCPKPKGASVKQEYPNTSKNYQFLYPNYGKGTRAYDDKQGGIFDVKNDDISKREVILTGNMYYHEEMNNGIKNDSYGHTIKSDLEKETKKIEKSDHKMKVKNVPTKVKSSTAGEIGDGTSFFWGIGDERNGNHKRGTEFKEKLRLDYELDRFRDNYEDRQQNINDQIEDTFMNTCIETGFASLGIKAQPPVHHKSRLTSQSDSQPLQGSKEDKTYIQQIKTNIETQIKNSSHLPQITSTEPLLKSPVTTAKPIHIPENPAIFNFPPFPPPRYEHHNFHELKDNQTPQRGKEKVQSQLPNTWTNCGFEKEKIPENSKTQTYENVRLKTKETVRHIKDRKRRRSLKTPKNTENDRQIKFRFNLNFNKDGICRFNLIQQHKRLWNTKQRKTQTLETRLRKNRAVQYKKM